MGVSEHRRFEWTVGGVFAVLGALLLGRHRTAAGTVVASLSGAPLLLTAAPERNRGPKHYGKIW